MLKLKKAQINFKVYFYRVIDKPRLLEGDT